MSKEKIEINENVRKLATKYMQITDANMTDLVNSALKKYLVDHLSPSQIKEALTENSEVGSKYTNELFRSNLDDLNQF